MTDTKMKTNQPPCDYCNFESMTRAAWAIRDKDGNFAGFMSLNNKGFLELNSGVYKIKIEPKPKFCPMCGRKLDEKSKRAN